MLKKINIQTARRLYALSIPVWFCQSKCFPSPEHPFNCAMLISAKEGESDEFKSVYNSFRYYNCNAETGQRVAFYVDPKLVPSKRKTRDEFNVESFGPYGWEVETCEATRREALQRLREYRENAPGVYRIKKRRVPIKQD